MKNYFVLIVLLALTSCAKKDSEENNSQISKAKIEASNACNCNELTLPSEDNRYLDQSALDNKWKDIMKDGKPYTGICVEKDQNDSILKQFEFKNGWTVGKLIREKIGYRYATLLDLTYDNLKPVDGYVAKLETDEDIKYVGELIVMTAGSKNDKESYAINIEKSATILINRRDNGDGDFIYDSLDGLRIVFPEQLKSKLSVCLKGFTEGTNHLKKVSEFYLGDASTKQRDELLDCLKNHANKFDYWKN